MRKTLLDAGAQPEEERVRRRVVVVIKVGVGIQKATLGSSLGHGLVEFWSRLNLAHPRGHLAGLLDLGKLRKEVLLVDIDIERRLVRRIVGRRSTE